VLFVAIFALLLLGRHKILVQKLELVVQWWWHCITQGGVEARWGAHRLLIGIGRNHRHESSHLVCLVLHLRVRNHLQSVLNVVVLQDLGFLDAVHLPLIGSVELKTMRRYLTSRRS